MPKAPSNVNHFDLVESGIERNGVPIGGPLHVALTSHLACTVKNHLGKLRTTKPPSSHPQMVVIVREFHPKMPKTFRFSNYIVNLPRKHERHFNEQSDISSKLLCDSLGYTDRNQIAWVAKVVNLTDCWIFWSTSFGLHPYEAQMEKLNFLLG